MSNHPDKIRAALGTSPGEGAVSAEPPSSEPPSSEPPSSEPPSYSRPLLSDSIDWADPSTNARLFGKLWGSYGDEPEYGVFHGTMWASIGDRKLMPLFGYAGTGVTRCRPLDDGGVQLGARRPGGSPTSRQARSSTTGTTRSPVSGSRSSTS